MAEQAGEQIFEKIKKSIEDAQTALVSIGQKSKAYVEDATFKSALDDANAALNSLLSQAKVLKDDAAEVPTKALGRAIVAANNAIEKLKKVAKDLDEKTGISKTVSKGVDDTLKICSVAVAEVSQYISDASSSANAHLQGVNDVIRHKLSETADRGLSFLMKTFAELDVKYDVREKTKQKLVELDSKFGIQEKAKSLDEKYDITESAKERGKQLEEMAKGPLLSSYEKGLKFATSGLEYLNDEFEKALLEKKREAIETELAAKAKAAAEAAEKEATNTE